MGLRRQLLMVATMALALPWAGCQYVKEMEHTLRRGQVAALQATAQAIASRVSSDQFVMSKVFDSAHLLSKHSPEIAYYVHQLDGEISLDGYSDDWRHMGFYAPPLTSKSALVSNPAMDVLMGQKDDLIYMLLDVKDVDRQFFNPVQGVNSSDHINLFLNRASGAKTFRIYSAASGIATIEGLNADGSWYREHRVAAVWNENESSYLLELRMPLSWLAEGLAIQAWDGVKGGPLDSESLGVKQLKPEMPLAEVYSLDVSSRLYQPVIIPQQDLSDVLAVFGRPGVKLHLILPGGWGVGEAGSVSESTALQGVKTWIYWLVRKIVGQADFPQLETVSKGGRLLGLPSTDKGMESLNQQWYLQGDRIIARVLVPIILPNGMVAAIVAEESTDSVEVLTTGAIGRLIFYSFLATCIVAFALLSYASVLSIRIRGLSRRAQQAVDREGRILNEFVASATNDEIGELSRSYGSLLNRLQSYNTYLESLAGKLSHELRTPLAIVSSSLDNLQQSNLTQEQRVYVERALGGGQRLSSMLRAMGAATQLERSIEGSQKEPINVCSLVQQVVSSYQDVYKSCQIHFHSLQFEPVTVMVAPELLVQMLDKLIENAVDFTGPEGQVWFELMITDGKLVIKVVNTGPLLPEQLQGQIFESLVSLRESPSKEVVGQDHLGLGLYIVRLIVRFHDGEVRAYNHRDGDRVVFEITLPI